MPAANAGTGVTHFSNLAVGSSSGGGSFNKGVVVIGDETAYSVLAADTGKLHLITAVTSDVTYTLPVAVYGMEYTFQYYGGAADAEATIFTAQAGNPMLGGVVTVDTGAGTSTDAYSDLTDLTLTCDLLQGGTKISFISDGTSWYVGGTVVSDTPAVFS